MLNNVRKRKTGKRETKIKIDDDKAQILLGCKEEGLKKGSVVSTFDHSCRFPKVVKLFSSS